MGRNTTFVGIDLAWAVDKNPTGVSIARGDQNELELVSVRGDLVGIDAITDHLVPHLSDTVVVAIDASLVVSNNTGQRPCETEVGRRFGRYGASCHSTNLGRPHARNGMRLVGALASLGFEHDFQLGQSRLRPGHWVFETYPHPAMVQLWALPQIIRYKKGRVADRQVGLRQLQQRLLSLTTPNSGLRRTAGLVDLLACDVDSLRGSARKRHEDSLDALFCAFLAWHCWRWGADGNEMIGTLETGYIVVPRGRDDASASTEYQTLMRSGPLPLV